MARPLRRLLVSCAAAAALVLAVAAAPEAQEPAVGVPSGFQDTVVFDGLQEPVAFRFAPDGRVFVAEKRGTIQVFDSLEDEQPTLFADLRKQTYDYLDHGLLGLALPPDFPTDPHVFAMYSFDHVLGEDPAGSFPHWGQAESSYEGDTPCTNRTKAPVDSCPSSGRLVRLVAEGDVAKGGAATPQEEVMITDWCGQSSTHSIGDLEFGPEGALYASGGEGAMASTPDYGQFGWTDAEIAQGNALSPPQERISRANQCGDPPGAPGAPLAVPDAEGGSLRSQDLITPAAAGDPTGLSGTVIRIDPATGEGEPDNPLHASASANERRIVAFGLRNPFRFTIHPDTGEVYVGNVAGGPEEEIDRFQAIPDAAYNSGWPCFEGNHPSEVFAALELDLCESLYETPGSTSPPLYSYSHHAGVSSEDPCPIAAGSAISGSDFYEGGPYPDIYDGALFFADSVRGCTYVMFPDEFGTPDPTTVMPFVHETDPYSGVDIQIGPDGLLYYASLFDPTFGPDSGAIHRVSYFSDNQPPVARLTATPEYGPEPVPAGFKSDLDASGSSDPENEMLTYEWDLDGDGVYEEVGLETEQEVTYHDEAEHFVAVRVKDQKGASSVARVDLYPGDTPPQVSILKPVEGAEPGVAEMTWKVGDPIEFEGVAHDAEDAAAVGEPMPSTSLSWSSRLYHCPGEGGCHAHPLQAFPTTDTGILTAPDHEYPSRIELKLTATDSRGLSASKTIVVRPVPVTLNIASNPAGVDLTAGFQSDEAPFPFTAIEGSSVTLSAPPTAVVGGVDYRFVSWSDSGARVHTIEAGPSQTAYTANYAVAEKRTVAVNAGGNGSGTVSAGAGAISGCSKAGGACSGEYAEGTTVVLTAAPGALSAVTWSGCDREPTATTCEVDVSTADRQVTATFTVPTVALAIERSGSGASVVSCQVGAGAFEPCASSYDIGDQLTVKADADADSAVTAIAGTGSASACTASPCSFAITEATTIEVQTDPIRRSLKIDERGPGDGFVTCRVEGGPPEPCYSSYESGTTIEAIATPARHSAGGSDVFAGSTGSAQGCASSPCSFRIAADTTLRAGFTTIVHALTVTRSGAGGGSVSCDGLACAPTYPEGSTVTLAAGAAAGSAFAGWAGAGCSGIGTCEVRIDGPTAVTAAFALKPRLRCRKHFRKKRVRGKPRCVRVKKHRRRHRRTKGR